MADKIKFGENISNEYEPTDSEEEYSENERVLLEQARQSKKKRNDSKMELMAFDESDDDEDETQSNNSKDEGNISDSDIEGAKDDDDDLPDDQDWGNRSRNYYNTDFVDPDYSSYNAQEEELAKQEEEEAKRIQLRLLSEMNEEDFLLADVHKTANEFNETLVKSLPNKKQIKADFATLSERERHELFKKDSPEFSGLVADFELYLQEIKDILSPVMNYVVENNVPRIPALKFAQSFRNIALTYCTNIVFYLLLKAKRVPLRNHPLAKRLVELKRLLKELDDKYNELIKPQLEALLERIVDGDVFEVLQLHGERTWESTKRGGEAENDNQQKADYASEENDIITDVADGDDSRRNITYQIAKNKGLTPSRKKELRNPRVKHRNKFRKALIRRKGAVRTARTETKRYDGELSGIKTTVVKSIKFKT